MSLVQVLRLSRSFTDDGQRQNATALELWIAAAAPMINAGGSGISAIVGVQGDVLYFDGTAWVALAAGTAGYVLSTGGPAANPSWVAAAAGSGGTFWQAEIDFGSAVNDYVEATVVAKTGATTSMQFSVTGFGATVDHDIEDGLLEGLVFDVSCVVNGEFFIRAYAPDGTFGRFKLNVRGETAVFTP